MKITNFVSKFKVKTISVLTSLLLLNSIFSPMYSSIAYAEDDSNVTIILNGEKFSSEVQAFFKDNRTMVPLRAVSEELGAEVIWDGEYGSVTISKDGSQVELFLDNRIVAYTSNGVTTYDVSDVAPVAIDGSTFVPLKLVGNVLGLDATWDASTGYVHLDDSITNEKLNFFDLEISNIYDGQIISGATQLSISGAHTLPSNAYRLSYFLLDSDTGMGKIVAQTNDFSETIEFLPDMSLEGSGALAAVVFDSQGNFIAGTAKSVIVDIAHNVTLTGVTEGEWLTTTTPLTCDLNFVPEFVKYEIHYPNREVAMDPYITEEIDPFGSFGYYVEPFENGLVSLRVVAYDSNATPYYSDFINVNVSATYPPPAAPYVNLNYIDLESVGVVPVTLSISRNFENVSSTNYYAKNVTTGEVKLLHQVGYGDYSWFPGPDMAGTWDLYVTCSTNAGNTYTSNTRRVTVPNTTSLTLKGIGPNEVITEAFSISSSANVSVTDVSYVLSNPHNGSQVTIGVASDTSTEVTFTPTDINEGVRHIQAFATTLTGQVIKSEVVPIEFYFGELFGAQPIVAQENFIDFVTPMAVQTLKKNGMSASLQIAQTILETGWGQSVPVDRYSGLFSNNLFGIKGTGDAGSVLVGTWEEYYGTVYRIDDYFRAYSSPEISWNDKEKLVLDNDRYNPYEEVMYDYVQGAYALKRCGYATDSAYAFKLIYLVDRYNLDELDNQKI